jgi:hypothetical protein
MGVCEQTQSPITPKIATAGKVTNLIILDCVFIRPSGLSRRDVNCKPKAAHLPAQD